MLRTALRRVLRIGLRVALIVTVLLLAAWVLRKPLFGGMVKREVTAALARATGGRYEIGDLGGNWLTELRILRLRTVEAPSAGGVDRLDVDEITLQYGLGALLADETSAPMPRGSCLWC